METDFSPGPHVRPVVSTATGSSFAMDHRDTTNSNRIDQEKVARGIELILEGLGEDVTREGLIDTPARVARMYQEMVYGLNVDPASEITCTFHEPGDNIVLVKDIPFASICEHHLIPFVGFAHIAYLPANGTITGLSKLARVVEVAARRLQVQERMTAQIAEALEKGLKPAGVFVILEAEHYCMTLRGIKKPGSKTVTTSVRGLFKQNDSLRSEVFMLLGK